MAKLNRRRYREQLAGASYTQAEWQDVLSKYGNKCLKCGATDNITIDHVIPISRGGDNTSTNLQPLCRKCNREKSDNIADYRADPEMTGIMVEKRWRIVLQRLGYKLDEPDWELSADESRFLKGFINADPSKVQRELVVANTLFDWLDENLCSIPQLLSWLMILIMQSLEHKDREAAFIKALEAVRSNLQVLIYDQGETALADPDDLLEAAHYIGDAYTTKSDLVSIQGKMRWHEYDLERKAAQKRRRRYSYSIVDWNKRINQLADKRSEERFRRWKKEHTLLISEEARTFKL